MTITDLYITKKINTAFFLNSISFQNTPQNVTHWAFNQQTRCSLYCSTSTTVWKWIWAAVRCSHEDEPSCGDRMTLTRVRTAWNRGVKWGPRQPAVLRIFLLRYKYTEGVIVGGIRERISLAGHCSNAHKFTGLVRAFGGTIWKWTSEICYGMLRSATVHSP